MSEFTFLFRGRNGSPSPEQMQQTMQKWLAWFKELGDKGHHQVSRTPAARHWQGGERQTENRP